jgi:hypothetical protein
LTAQVARLTRSLLESTNVGDALQRIVEVATDVVPGADLVSVTLRGSDGRFHTPVETDGLATKLDQAQYRDDRGPCLDAANPEGPAMSLCADLSTDTMWPQFSATASAAGFHSVLATALLSNVRPAGLSGALNLYSRKPDGFDGQARAAALLLATHASLALSGTEAVIRTELQAANLRAAIASRDVIGQAKGILMERRGVTADEAFDILRLTSQRLNVRLAEVAAALAARRADFDLLD